MGIDLEDARTGFVRGSLGGFPFVFVNAVAWLIMGGVFLWTNAAGVDVRWPALALIFTGAVTMPLAFVMQAALNLPAPSTSNPFPLLAAALSLVLVLGLPAPLIMWFVEPSYSPAVWAAVLGAHFLPHAWLQRTRWYVSLAILISLTAFLGAALLGHESPAAVTLITGALMLVWSFLIRRKARRLPAA
ncbi:MULTISPECIES: DUF7010 family protein [Euryhalocaulis]|uniref:DUF7010 family protein n=1 Tax=Euryhalocaulis TaxID=1712422 RepID=UPI0003A0C9D6|nr:MULTISPECIES: hypothetical protein [Euryhalocaulis]MBA4801847.1 hypothetical protein [Euryhalocaulis sp.]